MSDETYEALRPVQGAVEAALIENHGKFLRFLIRRLGNTDFAEDVLQQFYLRAVRKGSGLQKGKSVIAWLYKVLRTTLLDHYRRENTRQRLESDYARMELAFSEAFSEEADAELERTICACFETLLPTLKADYAEILRRVDLQESPPRDVARDLGLAPNTVRVRLHRARQALKHSLLRSCGVCAKHGCLDCDCGHREQSDGLSKEAASSVP